MTIINNLISKQNTLHQKYRNVIEKCIQLNNLSVYLHNLDKIAILNNDECSKQKNIQTINTLEMQNEQIMNLLKTQINEIVLIYSLNQEELLNYCNLLKHKLSNEVDMASLPPEKSYMAYKMYLSAEIISDILMKNNQEKTL